MRSTISSSACFCQRDSVACIDSSHTLLLTIESLTLVALVPFVVGCAVESTSGVKPSDAIVVVDKYEWNQ